jgi:hypothetical protein
MPLALTRRGNGVKPFALHSLPQFYFARIADWGMYRLMNKKLILIAPVAMLALAACNKSETPAADAEGDTAKTAEAPATPLPPAITSSGVYRCGDGTILHVDVLGANEAADIRVGDKTATAVRVTAPAAAAPAAGATPAPAEAKPAGPMKSADGKTSLTIAGKNVNVMLADKGAQTCKGS